MSARHDAALRALFPDSPPEWLPELSWLTIHDGNPDDYMHAVDVRAEDFPVYLHAPATRDALAALVEAIEFTPLGLRSLHALTAARKALAAADGAP